MKTFRPVVLAIIMISLVAAGLPVGDSLAHWSRRPHAHRKSKHKRVRRTRAWWRRHRAWLRQRQERAARRQTARLVMNTSDEQSPAAVVVASKLKGKSRLVSASNVMQSPRAPFDFAAPSNWRGMSAGAPGAMRFGLSTPDGRAAGTAFISPVALSGAEIAAASARGKSLASIPFAALRRTVIDRMVLESGWVVNDLERTIQGRRVYVVLAQSGAGGGSASQSWTFYFTEMDGRVYSLLTVAPVEVAAQVAADAEQVLASLRPGGAPVVAVRSPR